MTTHHIRLPEDLGLLIRAVRKSTGVRQDDLAGMTRVSRQFAVDVERGKSTVQLGRVMRLLSELGIELTVELTDDASNKLLELRRKRSERAHKAQISRLGAQPGESDGAPPDKTHDGEPGSGH